MNTHSMLLRVTMGAIYPFIIIFGIYVIMNGHITPGGGFQGGAIISSVFIVQYFTTYEKSISLHLFNRLEKILYVLILLFVTLFILQFREFIPYAIKPYYMLVMNMLIGAKVCFGLSVIFYRFVLFESR
ncbi:MAG: MnhB domain-containing protein [Vallitaleaceae bacterium]|nr:MnhB domain-containing protein [Vallitaleaceae bacterium]